MISFTLEIINTFLLFKFVLGYEFYKSRSPIVLGIAVIIFDYALRIIYYENMPMGLEYLFPTLMAMLPAFFFSGRKINVLFIGIFAVTCDSLLDTLSWGIATLIADGNIIDVNFQLADIVSRSICTMGILVIAIVLKEKKKNVRFYIEKMNIFIFIPFIISIFLIQLQSAYSGAVDQNWAHMIQGMNMTKSGLIGGFIILTFLLTQGLICQKKDLRRSLLLNQKCIKEQTAQYEVIGERDKELRKFRHDYNKHLTVMQNMAVDKKYEELADYVIQLGEMRSKINFISTNNIICDAIVNQYYERCKEEGILFLVAGKVPPAIAVPETDLCVILSNGVENAYEAALQCDGERKIQIKIKSQGNFILIEITNPTKEEVVIKDGCIETTKEDKEKHGMGTKNMREVAERNGGNVTWIYDQTGFVITKIYLRGLVK